MKKKMFKNYAILIILLICTVFLTLLLSEIYKSKNKAVSQIYNCSNKINSNEFDGYILENPDIIVYIADKYDLTYKKIENKIQNKIEVLNLKNKFIYMDKSELDDKFLSELKSKYNIVLDVETDPIILVILDSSIDNVVYVGKDCDIDTIIEYGEFK